MLLCQVSILCAPVESPWRCRSDWCVALLGFPNQKSARLWFISEPEIKQHDFPPPSDGFLIFSVRLRYPPVTGKHHEFGLFPRRRTASSSSPSDSDTHLSQVNTTSLACFPAVGRLPHLLRQTPIPTCHR